jgi:hypothetical protein
LQKKWRRGISPTSDVFESIIISALASIKSETKVRGWGADDMHIFVQEDERMKNSFLLCGAKPRVFGNREMVPGYYVLQDIAAEFGNRNKSLSVAAKRA